MSTVKTSEPTAAITMTKAAIEYIKAYTDKHPHALGMRLSVKKAGCSGLRYDVSAADAIEAQDTSFEQQGAKVIIAQEDLIYYMGTEIDYVKKGLNKILMFNNPNAEHACGCGESFSLKR